MSVTSVLAVPTQVQPSESFGICREPLPEPDVTRIHISFDGQFYEHMETRSKTIPDSMIIDRVSGAVTNVEPYVSQKSTAFKPAGSVTLKVEGFSRDPESGDEQHWQIELPCSYMPKSGGEMQMFVQCHYRSLLAKLQNVDLQAMAVMMRPKAGTVATFINVYLDDKGKIPVDGNCIPKGQEAFDQAVNRIRAGLGLPPLNTEWLAPMTVDSSPTPLVDVDSENY